jgi:hypothetical protein
MDDASQAVVNPAASPTDVGAHSVVPELPKVRTTEAGRRALAGPEGKT